MIDNWKSFNESVDNKPTQEQLENIQIIMDAFQDFEDEGDFHVEYNIVIQIGDYRTLFDHLGKEINRWFFKNSSPLVPPPYYLVMFRILIHDFPKDVFNECTKRVESLGFKVGNKSHTWIQFFDANDD